MDNVPSWLQSHLKTAESILERVDATVTKTVAPILGSPAAASATRSDANDHDDEALLPVKPIPFPNSALEETAEGGEARVPPAQPAVDWAGTSDDGEVSGGWRSSTEAATASGRRTSDSGAPQPSGEPQLPVSHSAGVVGAPAAPGAAARLPAGGFRVAAASLPATPHAPGASTVAGPSGPHGGGADVGAAAAAAAAADAAAAATAREQQLKHANEQLKKRLDVLRSENEQLEDMLQVSEKKADAARKAGEVLKSQVATLTSAKAAAEAEAAARLQQAQAAVARLQQQCDEAQRSVAQLEGEVARLTQAQQALVSSRSDIESGMLEAVRADLEDAYSKLEAEHKEHAATKTRAAAREAELEARLSDSSGALAVLQRSAHDAGDRLRELQDALASSEAQREQLEQQLAAAATAAAAGAAVGGTDATLARRSSGGGGGSVEMEMLRVEVAQLRDTLQLAESARRGAEKAAAAARDELGAHVGGAGQAAEARVLDLEQQLREMSEALVAKQGQLEKLSADKAASQMMMGRELTSYRDEVLRLRVQLQRHESAASSSRGDYYYGDVVPMDALPVYQRLVSNRSVGAGVKAMASAVDRTASSLSTLLRRYPLGRLLLLVYVIFIHVYMYALTAQLQSRAVAEHAVAVLPGSEAAAASGGASGTLHH